MEFGSVNEPVVGLLALFVREPDAGLAPRHGYHVRFGLVVRRSIHIYGAWHI
jgi:hypothetical protein